jgi:hypothetical protein
LATLKEFEEVLRASGMSSALAILEGLKKRDREQRSIAPARRVVGKKMTAELARQILAFHSTTGMTQQEIAFKLGVNQGRVNEVIKRGKWLDASAARSDHTARDKAMVRLKQRARRVPTPPRAEPRRIVSEQPPVAPVQRVRAAVADTMSKPRIISAQLAFLDL